MIKKDFIENGQEYNIYIGRNKEENWNLIDSADKCDLWFHLDGYPSPHVILKNTENITQKVIEECCILCKQYSKYKNFPSGHLKIVYTSINNIKKCTDIGSVWFINNKLITRSNIFFCFLTFRGFP